MPAALAQSGAAVGEAHRAAAAHVAVNEIAPGVRGVRERQRLQPQLARDAQMVDEPPGERGEPLLDAGEPVDLDTHRGQGLLDLFRRSPHQSLGRRAEPIGGGDHVGRRVLHARTERDLAPGGAGVSGVDVRGEKRSSPMAEVQAPFAVGTGEITIVRPVTVGSLPDGVPETWPTCRCPTRCRSTRSRRHSR